MDVTSIVLFALLCIMAAWSILALAGLLISTWFLLIPAGLLAAALAFADSGRYLYAFSAAVPLLLVLWGEYRFFRR